MDTAQSQVYRKQSGLPFFLKVTTWFSVYADIICVDFVDLASINKAADNSVSYGLKSSAKSPMLFYGIGFNISFAKSDKSTKPDTNYAPRPRQPTPSHAKPTKPPRNLGRGKQSASGC